MPEISSLINVRAAHVSIRSDHGEIPILRDVNFDLRVGETLGLVGESGSGKSMTARLVSGLLPRGSQVHGEVLVHGRPVAATDRAAWRQLRAQSIAMVFQDPRAHMNPVHSIGDFLTEVLVTLRAHTRNEAEELAVRALDDVGVERPSERLRQYPHELSGGLLQRVMVAAALLSEPAVLLADEPTTALDVTTQSELVAIIREQQAKRSMAVLFITHDLDLAAAICDRVVVMYAGEIVEEGPPSILEHAPQHPYTAGLIAARPDAFATRRRLLQLEGAPLAASEVGPGCAFRSRCPIATNDCAVSRPALTIQGHRAWRCFNVDAVPSVGV